MYFLVTSNPLYLKPGDIEEVKVEFKEWLSELNSKGKVINAFQKIGKGSVIVFNLESNEELNEVMSKWLSIVPVPITYEITPLVNSGLE